jgi:hypothetical protein
LQVFNPAVTTFDVDDGIYAYRFHAYLVISLVPLALSSLAFVNPNAGYTVQGAFCLLPEDPVWYRLVLAWIPRFIIAIAVIGIASAIYVHVQKQLKEFSDSQKSSRTSLEARGLTPPILLKILPFPKRNQRRRTLSIIDEGQDQERYPPTSVLGILQHDQQNQSPAPILRTPHFDLGSSVGCSLTPSLISPKAECGESPVVAKDYAKHDYFNLRPGVVRKSSSEDCTAAGFSNISTHPWDRHGQLPSAISKPSNSDTLTTSKSSNKVAQQLGRRVSIAEPSSKSKDTSMQDSLPTSEQQNDNQRRALRKSLRRVFVYPTVYVVLWIPPCIISMRMLSPNDLISPTSWLAILSDLSLTLMGGFYCAVFLWSEEPWRHCLGHPWIWGLVSTFLCFHKDKDHDVEFKAYDSPGASGVPSLKSTSVVSNSTTSYASHPSEGVIQALSNIQTPARPVDKRTVLGQHASFSTTSLAKQIYFAPLGQQGIGSSTSLPKQISFAPLGQLRGGSTTSLAKQLAYERLNLEKQDRKNHLYFQKRVARTSGLSLGSRGSVMTSLGSITEATRREWWDHEDDGIGEEDDEEYD